LDILSEKRDLGSILLVKELFSNSAAFLSKTDLLRVEESALNIWVTATIAHERDGVIRAGLGPNITLMAVEYRLVAQGAIGINEGIVVTIAFPGIDIQLGDGNGIDAGCLRNKVGGHVVTRSDALGIERL
jgi:hypothetical protein